jgi:hypothetical protein
MSFFTECVETNPKIHMGEKKNPGQQKQFWQYHNSQVILKVHNNKNSMVLAQKQTVGPIE